jgi:hypothetical protein
VNLETYWFVAPLVLTVLSGFGWIALWITRRGARRQDSMAEENEGL